MGPLPFQDFPKLKKKKNQNFKRTILIFRIWSQIIVISQQRLFYSRHICFESMTTYATYNAVQVYSNPAAGGRKESRGGDTTTEKETGWYFYLPS